MWGNDAETARLVATALLVSVVAITIGIPVLLELRFWFQKRRIRKARERELTRLTDRLLDQRARLDARLPESPPGPRAVPTVRHRVSRRGSHG